MRASPRYANEPLATALREARPPLVLAIDIGTSGLRTFLFDVRGRPVGSAIAHRDRTPRTAADGEVSVDPDERVRAAADAIDETLAAAGRRAKEIAAVATSTFWHSLVGVDARGRPTTRVLTWADTRARNAAAALRSEVDPRATHARTGCTFHASYWPAKLRYLKEADREAYVRTAKWLSLGEYLYFRLFSGTRAALFLGTSGAIRVLYATDGPPVVAGGWTYRLDARRVVAGGALSNGGNVIAWLARTFPQVDLAKLWRSSSALGLIALPLLAGDRTPSWNDAARGALAGIGLTTTAEDIARATLEGVAFRAARVWRLVDAALPGIATVVATGGTLLRLPWLMQLFADALDRPVVMSGAGEGSARGAAIAALERVGIVPTIAAVRSPLGRTYRPDAAAHARLAEGLARQSALEDALASMT